MHAAKETFTWIEEQSPAMRSLVEQWCRINSGTDNLVGVGAMYDQLEEVFAPFAGEVQRIPVTAPTIIGESGEPVLRPLGDALSVRCRPAAPVQVFLGGHMDTVYPVDSPFQDVTEIDADTLLGPGVADMKGGLVVMLFALRALERSSVKEKIGWEVLIGADEEIGSPGSAPLFEEAAKRNSVGLVFEPSLPDGAFISQRKGSGNYTAVIRGRTAHVGREFSEGRSTMVIAAELVSQLHGLNSDQVIVNIGQIQGGGPVNVVPDLALVRFNLRVDDVEAYDNAMRTIHGYAAQLDERDGYSVTIHESHFRAPKPFTDSTKALFSMVEQCATELGLPYHQRASGGVCDGNILANSGLPTIDTLGVRGGKIHTPEEYLILPSLVERAKLTTSLLTQLAEGGFNG
jgi:glutamate carboxypeptidase